MAPVPALPSRLATWSYRLERLLGRGASSEVWLASAPGGVRVALKISADAARLAEEAERLLGSSSRWIPAIHDAGVIPSGELAGRAFLALDWIDGEVLDPRAQRSRSQRERLALLVAREIGAALADLHGLGTAHGDVKPDNVLLEQRRAWLVDLGLGGEAAEREVRGGTLRYLAPEAEGDARTRDLWALGLMLAEIASASVARSADPARAVREARLEGSLGEIVRALLAPAPGARPPAGWVSRRAATVLGDPLDPQARIEQSRLAVRRAYLATRRLELLRAGGSIRIAATGPAGEWLRQAAELLAKTGRLRGGRERAVRGDLGDLDPLGRRRWLVALVGPAAAHWPALDVTSDGELAHRLLEACAPAAPESFTLAMLQNREPAAPRVEPRDPIALALALAAGRPSAETLDAAESAAPDASEPFLLALGRALRLAGETGRALAVLGLASSPALAVEAAETERRAGDPAGARARLERIAAADPETLARRAAVLARLELDAGRSSAALEIAGAAAPIAPVLEVRALAELASGQRARAKDSALHGKLAAQSDEERARLEAVLGTIDHADGASERALAAFRSAVEHAARAGAVLEEATYLTGVAANATQVGELGEALAAAERATLLFEHLGRAREAARAALARASAFAITGAEAGAREAVEEAIARAGEAGDDRCRGFAHLALADLLADSDPQGVEHSERALLLLCDAGADDRLAAAARLLRRRPAAAAISEHDEVARDPARAIDARLEWWGARARVLARAPELVDPEPVLRELGALATVKAAVAVRGPAFAAGAELAARAGDGEAARRFGRVALDAAQKLLERAPRELRLPLEQRDWVAGLQRPAEIDGAPEQLGAIDGLVRALAARDRLRPLLDRVLDSLVLWTGVERGLLLLTAPEDRLVVRAARNLARTDLDPRQRELSLSLARRAIELGEPVVAVDAAGELPELHQSVHALKLRSVLAVPLVARGEPLGVVYLDDRVRRGAFGPRELAWVKLCATLASVAIAEARDQLLLRRAARRARRAEARLAAELAEREAALDVAHREIGELRDQVGSRAGKRGTRFSYPALVGKSPELMKLLRLVDRVSPTEVPVLILGESGSGKELVARAIHDNGPRRAAAFVSENCAAIPEALLESALFGHVRGAFTGASRPRAGLFDVADGGTLFLDEIGEMSLGMQTKLLRVIEDGEVRAVGAERARKVDVRVIAATHRDLESMAGDGSFRQDLLYRLNVITLRVPSLRERSSDIPLLAAHFIAKHTRKGARALRLSRSALAALVGFSWPGNVRQLENEIRRALVLADDSIELEHLSPDVRAGAGAVRGRVKDELNLRQRVDALEQELVTIALDRTRGNQTRAAELLGLSRFGLQKMLKRLGIETRRTTA
jgi:serine/threonine-protein kinase PknK